MEDLHENCGIAAAHIRNWDREKSPFGVVPYLYKLLLNLQNRGQLSAGITTFSEHRPQIIDTFKHIGPVNEVFKTSNPLKTKIIFNKYKGSMGIGHVRYATCGANDRNYAQPFERHHGRKWKWFSFGFNGQISNYYDLKKPLLEKSGYHLILDCDTEIIMHYLSKSKMLDQKKPLLKVFGELASEFDGAYSLAYINADGDMVIVRDPWGFRPISYGYIGNVFLAASETNALANLGMKTFNYLKPGEMLHISKEGKLTKKMYTKPKRKAHCMFEWVYFANVSSILENKSVYVSRINLGKELAKLETEKVNPKDYVVVPVPDTAKASGDSMAYELGLPSKEGLIRNRYVGRTFIEGKQSRNLKVKTKYSIIKQIIKGKKIILVDDSIVRGTTLKELINYIKEEGGAKEVHVRISCPPIMGPCFYGIDMSTIEELFAPKYIKKIDKNGYYDTKYLHDMAKDIGADSLIYMTIEGMVRSIGLPKDNICTACLDSDYPTPSGRSLYKKACENIKSGKNKKRTYECSAL